MPPPPVTGTHDHRPAGSPASVTRLLEPALRESTHVRGHHNDNYVFTAAGDLAAALDVPTGTRAKLRRSIPEQPEVVIRGWIDEAVVLDAVSKVISQIPRCLASGDDFSVHTYAEGDVLSAVYPAGKPLDDWVLDQILALLTRLAAVDTTGMSPTRECWRAWPEDGDTNGFLHRLIQFTEEQVYRPHRDEYRRLFLDLGIPEGAMRQFRDTAPVLQPRPFTLLHTDLHRDNLVLQENGCLFVLDWELALVGDPLYELATHLCRMAYPPGQWDDVVRRWDERMGATDARTVTGLERDLAVYLRYERVQSIYPDVLRAVRRLRDQPHDETADGAARMVTATLQSALPLIGECAPPYDVVRTVLTDWTRRRA